MSDATHEIVTPVVSLRSQPVSTTWSTLPVGESRFHQVRRQLRMLQVQRAAFGTRAA